MKNSRTFNLFCYSLLAYAFCLPLSIALVQPAAYLASLLGLFYFITSRESYPGIFEFRWSILIFLSVIVVTAITGIRTGHSFEKMNRFILFFIAWAIPFSLRDGNQRTKLLERLVVAFVLGATLKAAYDFVRVPTAVQMGTPLFQTGNMRDPQMYYAAICMAAGLFMTRAWSFRYPPAVVSFVILCGGFIIHFKRGAWAACLGALAIMAVISRKWRYLGILLLFGILLVSLPQTRQRLGALQSEFDSDAGGRLTLWTKVAPVLIKEHPMGVGWKGITHEDFIAVSANVEKGLNHLHNNILQVTLELGVAGLAAWLFLVGSIFTILFKNYRATYTSDRTLAGISLGVFGAFTGLMLNGMVEYNFGDSEIFMIIVLIMGLAAGVSAIRIEQKNGTV